MNKLQKIQALAREHYMYNRMENVLTFAISEALDEWNAGRFKEGARLLEEGLKESEETFFLMVEIDQDYVNRS